MIGSQLLELLAARVEAGNPLRVALIGAGRLGTMFLSQVQHVEGVHVLGIGGRSLEKSHQALQRAGWPQEQYAAASLSRALETGSTCVTNDMESLIQADGLDVLIEGTGNPTIGIRYAQQAIKYGRHLVMVNVEADVLAGPLLAQQAKAAGLVYSMAYGDQPAEIIELVEWAYSNGFEVVCAGKGAKYLPIYRRSTPETAFEYFGYSQEKAEREGLNPRTYSAALDGTKPSVEMAAVVNGTDLVAPPNGLKYPPCGIQDLAHICRPKSQGGQLDCTGTVEVVASLERDGRPVHDDLRLGVYVTLKASNDYVRRCFMEYMTTDESGWYAAMYRPYHLVGLELLTSVLKVGLRGEPTGYSMRFGADVVATAKSDLTAGTPLDGEGGNTVYGSLMPAMDSVKMGALPMGLAHDVKLKNAIVDDQVICWSDVEYDAADPVIRFRREMERQKADE